MAGAGKKAGGQPLQHRFHLHRALLVDPAARFDVDGLAGRERDFKHIAKTVQPEDAFPAGTGKSVNEEAGAAEQNVGGTPHAGEGVIHGLRGGQPLVFAHIHPRAGLQMQAKDMACAIAAEGNAARPPRPGEQKRHAGQHALEGPFDRMQFNRHSGILPQQDVMFKIDAGLAQFQMQRRHQFAFDMIGDATEGFVLDVRG